MSEQSFKNEISFTRGVVFLLLIIHNAIHIFKNGNNGILVLLARTLDNTLCAGVVAAFLLTAGYEIIETAPSRAYYSLWQTVGKPFLTVGVIQSVLYGIISFARTGSVSEAAMDTARKGFGFLFAVEKNLVVSDFEFYKVGMIGFLAAFFIAYLTVCAVLDFFGIGWSGVVIGILSIIGLIVLDTPYFGTYNGILYLPTGLSYCYLIYFGYLFRHYEDRMFDTRKNKFTITVIIGTAMLTVIVALLTKKIYGYYFCEDFYGLYYLFSQVYRAAWAISIILICGRLFFPENRICNGVHFLGKNIKCLFCIYSTIEFLGFGSFVYRLFPANFIFGIAVYIVFSLIVTAACCSILLCIKHNTFLPPKMEG